MGRSGPVVCAHGISIPAILPPPHKSKGKINPIAAAPNRKTKYESAVDCAWHKSELRLSSTVTGSPRHNRAKADGGAGRNRPSGIFC
jgi:hypothetical protein